KTISACVAAPGRYRAFVSSGTPNGGIYEGISCSGGNRYSITVTCEDSCSPAINDSCANATTIVDGATFFDTTMATTDGPTHASCDNVATGDTQIHDDIWYQYTATCTGDLIVDTCNSAGFNTRIAVYDGCDCPVSDTNLLTCNDDLFNCESGSSALYAPVIAGNCYLIRIGGRSGARGLGTIRVNCLGGGVCPDAGDCNTAHATPSCSDPLCCDTVCALDQYCCLVEWDDVCVQLAAQNCTGEASEACCLANGSCVNLTTVDCQIQGGTSQGPGSNCTTVTCTTAQPEACCISEGVCINLTPADCANLPGSPQGPGTTCGGQLTCFSEACCLPDETCAMHTTELCLLAGGEAQGNGTDCATVSCSTTLEACCLNSGECFDVSPEDCILQTGTPLGPGTQCSSNPCAFTCPTDIGPLNAADGMVDVNDLLVLLAAWGPCQLPCAEDIVQDGVINVTDLLSLLSAWGSCP
ncbi:MAG: hypothetical protein O7G85_11050, partial [Planctomycetota bacterium]|nr:hypothetical protein [Planctomycetota bacterium]